MNSFTLTAIGNLARNPEAVAKGDTLYTRFCLVGNDYAGKDDEGQPREITTTIWFVAFGATADSLVRNARKGDQVFVEARVRSNIWTDKQGEKQHNHEFVVQGFRFGAPGRVKREEREARREDFVHRGNGRVNGRDNGAHAGDVGEPHSSTSGESRANGEADVGGHAGTAVTKAASAPSEPASNGGAATVDASPKTAAGADALTDVTTDASETGVASPAKPTKGSNSSEKPATNRSGRRSTAPPP